MKLTLKILMGALLVAAAPLGSDAFAATKTIKGKIKGVSGGSVRAITALGSVTAELNGSGKFSATLPDGATSARLVYVNDAGKMTGVLYAKKCRNASGGISCVSGQLAPTFKGGTLPAATYSSTTGRILVGNFKSYSAYAKSVTRSFVRATVAASGKNFGYLGSGGTSAFSAKALKPLASDPLDNDGDGAPNEADIDDDNDGVTDNYDGGGESSGTGTTFRVFSNLKVEMPQSLNVNAVSVTQAQIDSLMEANTTLAVQVQATGADTSELDCAGLTYCSAGGTGVALNGSTAFPGAAGGANDADSDGLGEITAGGTGDFQLRTGADAASIGTGDLLTQLVTSGGTTSSTATAMLGFTFNTTPAVKTIAINTDPATTITYPVSNTDAGTANNCFVAPSAGDISVTLTAWRPQRPGIPAAGEGTYVDIGNSIITVDIPNAPCPTGTSGGCSGNGPGNCGTARMTESDANLETSSGLMRDTASDTDADAANTYTFTLDLTGCLTDGGVSWAPGEKVFLDLQMRNEVGDNAAQKFCIQR